MLDGLPTMRELESCAAAFSRLKPIVVIVGPTAIGKSRVAIQVAKIWGTEILSADSTQVYRGMDIGTDKPTPADHAEVPHRLIDLVEPDQSFNVGEFRKHAVREIARLHDEGRLPLVVGGTGLYVRALLRGLWPGPPPNPVLRKQLEREAVEGGMEALVAELRQVDPDLGNVLHPNDRIKILRALEVFRQTGLPLSVAHRQHQFQERPFRSLVLGLTMERESLHRRIEDRVEVEIAKGLVEETRRLLDKGYARESVPMKSLGYRQISGYLEGEYSYEEAVRRLKRDTRHFAKRQMTWFRKEPNVQWIEVSPHEHSMDIARRVSGHIDRFMSALGMSRPTEPGAGMRTGETQPCAQGTALSPYKGYG